MANVIEINGPAMLQKLLEEAIQTIQPAGEAREILSDAKGVADQMVQWFHELRETGTNVSPSWTDFIHSSEQLQRKASR